MSTGFRSAPFAAPVLSPSPVVVPPTPPAGRPGAAPGPLRSSIPLHDRLAGSYDAHFAVPHRRACDELAWEIVSARLPPAPALIVDAGCGSGRWAQRLTRLGHHVIGIEQAPRMAAAARRRLTDFHDRFQLVEEPMETADVGPLVADRGGAHLVLAMGSLQYAEQPEKMLGRLAGWVRPGGEVLVLVDSLVALVQELLDAGDTAQALDRLETRRGVWQHDGLSADLHLLDATRLRVAYANAGLSGATVHGLLASWSAVGRGELLRRLDEDWPGQLAIERRLAADPLLADLGKQLLAVGRRPA